MTECRRKSHSNVQVGGEEQAKVKIHNRVDREISNLTRVMFLGGENHAARGNEPTHFVVSWWIFEISPEKIMFWEIFAIPGKMKTLSFPSTGLPLATPLATFKETHHRLRIRDKTHGRDLQR